MKKEFNPTKMKEWLETKRMMPAPKKEFNLSKRAVWFKKKEDQWKSYIHTMHVKEFIRLIKFDIIPYVINDVEKRLELQELINKRAGKELTSWNEINKERKELIDNHGKNTNIQKRKAN